MIYAQNASKTVLAECTLYTHIVSHLTHSYSHMFDGDLHRKCTNYVFTHRNCACCHCARWDKQSSEKRRERWSASNPCWSLQWEKGTRAVALAIRQNKHSDKCISTPSHPSLSFECVTHCFDLMRWQSKYLKSWSIVRHNFI